MKKFLKELQRRGVIKTLVAYIGLVWLVMQVVEVVSGLIDVHEMVGPTTVIVFACLAPVVLYISWYFEWHEGSMRRTVAIDSGKLQPLGFFSWFGLVTVLSFSSYLGYDFLTTIAAEKAAEAEGMAQIKQAESIAVLPFTDQSPEKDQGYLAVGLAEELTSLLGRSEGFRVAASRSSQILAEKGLPPVDIGKRLDVETVLTGSVRATGSRLKIRVELLDTETGHTLWTENFLRELKDIFELESEIGRAVINLLQDKYLEAGSFKSLSSTSSTDAYVMYLKGREEYRKQTTESMKEARKLFEQAVALDPEYAMGYTALADTILMLSEGEENFGVLKTDIAVQLAQSNMEKSLVREPLLAESYAILGSIDYFQGNYDDSLVDFDKAIELNPSLAIAYMWKYNSFVQLQRYDEGLAVLQKAKQLDPLFPSISYNLGFELASAGKIEEAEEIYKQLILDHPQSPFAYSGLADIYFGRGDFVGAIREGLNALNLSKNNTELQLRLVGPLLQLGLTEEAKSVTDDPKYDETILIMDKKYDELFNKMEFELNANPGDPWVAFEAGWYHSRIGDKDKGILLLAQQTKGFETSQMFNMPTCIPAIDIAWAYLNSGEKELAETLIENCEQLLFQEAESNLKYFELSHLDARLKIMRGDKRGALVSLESAIQNGLREWWTKYDPIFETLRNEPEFQRLMKIIDDDLARQAQEAKLLFE
ncbi:tetratricopeptide repeat protein [Aestuariibacter salexigens]|uniref:tetratricopeptide repeat protein n=1 Tax=Aestuariibacter salexigens TaxID=226010 RepID=UPI00040418E9|nr:tetratricopeptide repeat protein [Aestuariibacter salexigens]